MTWYTLFFVIALLVCMASLSFHLVLLIKAGNPPDYATPSGSIPAGIQYSFTGAMSPVKKESAFLHLPTYTAGIIYHLGTFLSVFLIFILWADVIFPPALLWGLASYLLVSALCGISILVKRIIKKGLRELSNPDDYISNILVTVFQILTGLTLVYNTVFTPWLILAAGLLLLYIPLGKLKHLLYFFAARWQLGLFYGRRGVWPPLKNQKP
ncbi:MAG: hypothetical protein NTW31_14510 [Bacteroidetes bacterium]|nr:hypothetical protein [Bacteroidota bacterium]